MRRSRYLLALTLIAAVALGTGTADASPIDPGFDSFVTAPGAFVDLNALGLGIIDVEGVPIGPNAFGPDDADTIVQRLDGINPFPVGGSDTIEIIALSLTSIDPVDLTPLGGPFIGVFSDLYATINEGGLIPQIPQPDALQPSIGRMEINHEILSGGTFKSCFGDPGDPLAFARSSAC